MKIGISIINKNDYKSDKNLYIEINNPALNIYNEIIRINKYIQDNKIENIIFKKFDISENDLISYNLDTNEFKSINDIDFFENDSISENIKNIITDYLTIDLNIKLFLFRIPLNDKKEIVFKSEIPIDFKSIIENFIDALKIKIFPNQDIDSKNLPSHSLSSSISWINNPDPKPVFIQKIKQELTEEPTRNLPHTISKRISERKIYPTSRIPFNKGWEESELEKNLKDLERTVIVTIKKPSKKLSYSGQPIIEKFPSFLVDTYIPKPTQKPPVPLPKPVTNKKVKTTINMYGWGFNPSNPTKGRAKIIERKKETVKVSSFKLSTATCPVCGYKIKKGKCKCY